MTSILGIVFYSVFRLHVSDHSIQPIYMIEDTDKASQQKRKQRDPPLMIKENQGQDYRSKIIPSKEH